MMRSRALTSMFQIFTSGVFAGIAGEFGDLTYFVLLLLVFAAFSALMLLGTAGVGDTKPPLRMRRARINLETRTGHPFTA